MSKRAVSIVFLVAVALTAFSFFLSRRDSEDWRSSQARRLFPFPWRDVVAVRIVKPDGRQIDLERQPGEEWRIALGDENSDSLNPQAAEELSALVMLPWRQPLAGVAPPDPDGAVRLTASGVGGDQITLFFGPLHGNLLTVSSDDDPGTVFGVVPDLAKVLDWPEARFRNLFLVAEPGRRPSRLVLHPAGSEDGDNLVVARAGGAWRLVQPVDWPAESSRVEQLLAWLDRLQAEEIVSDRIEDPAAFGFGPDSAAVEVHYEDETAPVVKRVEFGDVSPDAPESLYARAAGRNALFTVPKFILAEVALNQPAGHLREMADFYRLRMFDILGPPPPRRLVVERLLPVPERLVIERGGERNDAKWTGTLERGGGSETFAVEPPTSDDPLRPLTRLLTGLSGLRVRSFLADGEPGPETVKWTAYPAWRFEAVGADGVALPPLTLFALDASGSLPPGQPFVEGHPLPVPMGQTADASGLSGIAAVLEGRRAVVELAADLAYLLCLPPYRYQSRRLLDQDVASWKRVELKQPGSEAVYVRGEQAFRDQWWRAGAPNEPLFDDNNRFAALLLVVSQLRTTAFVADADRDPAEFGLDQPEITMIVYGSLEQPEGDDSGDEPRLLFTLAVGSVAEGADSAHYARLDGSGSVFLLPADLVEALAQDYR